jgi:hypothetical protein
MKENVLRTATIAGERVAQGFTASKEAVVDAFEDGKKLVKRRGVRRKTCWTKRRTTSGASRLAR